jgi:hypothetical protein
MPTDLTPLLRYCLETTATQLSREFRGVSSHETIRRYVEACCEQLGDRRAVGPNFLPVIIERLAREQLWAIAQSTGAAEKALPEVLFVCEHNAGRSQMAACLTHHLSNGWIGVRSAGSHPDGQIDPIAVAAMSELGLDVTTSSPSRSPTRSSPLPTSWSRWGARGRLPGLPGQVLRGTGRSLTRPASRWRRSGRSGMSSITTSGS